MTWRRAAYGVAMSVMEFTNRLMMAITGPVVGLVSGVVIGLLALGAGKLIKGPVAPTVKTTA